MTVGERIKQFRETRGMSQEELAQKMGYKDRSSISKIEKASDTNLSLETVQKVAEILECSPLTLMGWDKNNLKEEIKYSAEDEQFIKMYHCLDAYQRGIVENMLTALTSRKEVDAVSPKEDS